MFLQKNMFRLNEWFISLPKNYIYFSWKSISFFNPPEESQLDMYVYLLYIQTWFDKTIQQMSTARTGSASGLGFGSHETLAGSSTWASKLTQFVGVKQPQVTDL